MGDSDGLFVGFKVGELGAAVTSVGDSVGVKLGCTDGSIVGVVGESVGFLVGDIDGSLVGEVGLEVGASVHDKCQLLVLSHCSSPDTNSDFTAIVAFTSLIPILPEYKFPALSASLAVSSDSWLNFTFQL